MLQLTGKRVAILAETLYQDQELWYPFFRLQEAGAPSPWWAPAAQDLCQQIRLPGDGG